MNRNEPMLQARADRRFDLYATAIVWLLFALCFGVLVWFVTVLNQVTERGEQRRHQQRTTGSLVLADEQRNRDGVPVVGALSVTNSPVASR